MSWPDQGPRSTGTPLRPRYLSLAKPTQLLGDQCRRRVAVSVGVGASVYAVHGDGDGGRVVLRNVMYSVLERLRVERRTEGYGG